ncbi:dynein axonemal assembly factor 5 isoform X3 [Tachypleus tridentatus]|uniref:dynein axonemal assembly factor 5 isoform X3 n=1 Tax=Tachypleus tridentatus TaxID=6853 RepID=UPI003FD19A98
MAKQAENSCERLLHVISRHLSCLKDDDKIVRKRSMESIKKELSGKQKTLSVKEYDKLALVLFKPFLKCICDPVERVRELSAEMIHDFVENSSNLEEISSYLIPIFVQRLGLQELLETSEEVRLLEVQTLTLLVSRLQDKMACYLNDMIKILVQTIEDQYPEVKKTSCICASQLARVIPAHFHMQSESLIKPLLRTVSHQHAKVRAVCVKAIGDVVQYGNNSSVNDVISHLAQRLFDQAPIIRQAVVCVAGRWLSELPDRYSFFSKLIPLVMTGLTDELPNIREDAENQWKYAGQKYLDENEKEVKDQLDFAKPYPDHYPSEAVRPTFGCRLLVKRHLYYILPALLRDLDDWVAATRIKSANLLYVLLLHSEESMTSHLEKLFPALKHAVCDEEREVVEKVQKSAELLGYFVKTETWSHVYLPTLSTSPGALLLLAFLIGGSPRTEMSPCLPSLADVLASPDIRYTVNSSDQLWLATCVEYLLMICGDDCIIISYQLFIILLTIQGLAEGDEKILHQVGNCLSRLADIHQVENVHKLYEFHSKHLLQHLKTSHQLWTVHSPEWAVFHTVISNGGPALENLTQEWMPMVIANLHPSKDPNLRLKLFALFSANLNSQGYLDAHLETFLKDGILVNLVWHAGRTESAMRTAVVSCLWALVQAEKLESKTVALQLPQLLNLLLSLLDNDDSTSTRLMVCKVLSRILPAVATSLDDLQKLHKLYPVLLKRMDDVCDDVRLAAMKVFPAYFQSFPSGYNATLYAAHRC